MFIPIAGYLYCNRNTQSTHHSQQVKDKSSSRSIFFLISFIISLWEAHLSWSCNTTKLIGFVYKVSYAIGAFGNSIFYILNYYVFI